LDNLCQLSDDLSSYKLVKTGIQGRPRAPSGIIQSAILQFTKVAE